MQATRIELASLEAAWANRRPDAKARTDRLSELCILAVHNYKRHRKLYPGELTAAQTLRRASLKANAEASLDFLNRVASIVSKYDTRVVAPDDDGPTAETILRLDLEQNAEGDKSNRPFSPHLVSDPVLKLYAKGELSDDDLHDAREIAGIFRRITTRNAARTMKWDCLSEPGEEGQRFLVTDVEEHYLLLHSRVFTPWTKRVDKADLGATLDLCCHGMSPHALRTKYRRGEATVVKRIKESLEVYRRIRGDHYRGEVQQAPRQAA